MNTDVPRGAALLASPPGASGHQAARIHGVKRDVGADGGVDGGFDLRVVLDAGLRDAAGEVDQRLFLGQRRQHADGGFQAGQLAVRIEDVEFGFVGDECGPGVFAAVGVSGVGLDGEFAGLADVKALDHLGQAVAVAGEILDHVDARRRRVMMDTMSDGVICSARNFRCGLLRTDLFLGLHGREIEEQHQQALVPVLDLARRLHIDDVGPRGHGGSGGREPERPP